MLTAALSALAAGAAPALAEEGHKFLGEVTEAPPGTAISEATAVTVSSTGKVFLADQGEGLIDEFGPGGKFEAQFGEGALEGAIGGLAVDSGGRVYVADGGTNTIDVFKPAGATFTLVAKWTGAGTPEKAFGELAGVAVAPSGTVYALDKAGAVYVFSPPAKETEEGTFTGVLGAVKGKSPLSEREPSAIAVQPSTEKVYVAAKPSPVAEHPVIWVFSKAGALESKLVVKGSPTKGLLSATALSVEDPGGDIYVADAEASVVDQLTPAGEWVGWIPATEAGGKPVPLSAPAGVALASAGDVWVTQATALDHFEKSTTVPTVTTGKATKVTRTSATADGTVGGGKPAEYYFELTDLTSQATTTTAPAPVTSEKVQAAFTSLTPQHLYQVRLIVKSEGIFTLGAPTEFETPPAVSGVTTSPATEITVSGATLNGSLEPNGEATKYRFEYGETTAYGHAIPVEFLESSKSGVEPIVEKVTGLKPNTAYDYRLVAFNSFGTTFGQNQSFKTTGPTIITKPAQPVGPTTATLNAEINPDNQTVKYHFEYGTSTAYGTSTPTETIAPGTKTEHVSANLTGLKLATTYHYRLVVESEEGGKVVGTFTTPDQEFTTVLIAGVSASDLEPERAKLSAQLLPEGANVTFQFEYGETEAYGQKAPEPAETVTGTGEVVKSTTLTGLRPGATYHYRLTASVQGNPEHVVTTDHTFTTPTTGGVTTLPDGRGYELVSPSNKGGGLIEPLTKDGGDIQAAANGGAFAYVVDGPVVENVEGNRSPEQQQVLSVRGATWANEEVVAPHDRPWGLSVGKAPEYQLFSSDLSHAIMQPFPSGLTPMAEPALAPPATPSEAGHEEKTIYLRDNNAHSYTPLFNDANLPSGTTFGGTLVPGVSNRVNPQLSLSDATPDLGHAVLAYETGGQPEPAPEGLYEWAAGQLQLISRLPSGEVATKPKLGFEEGQYRTHEIAARNAISNDGSRVVWTTEESGAGQGHLYLRQVEEGGRKGETVQLDKPEAGLPVSEHGNARFQIASIDGTRIFFTDDQRLTTTSTAVLGQPDLYECEVPRTSGALPACKLKDLSAIHSGSEHANVQGMVLGAAENGSAIYFVATGVLPEGTGATSGGFNLYRVDLSGEPKTRFIATLSNEDLPTWNGKGGTEAGGHVLLVQQTARVSPDGNLLAFMSNRRLTGYDNTDVVGNHADEEVFMFNQASPGSGIACISCNPSGARPRGVHDQTQAGEGEGLLVDRPQTWVESVSNPGADHWLAGSIPGWTSLTTNGAIYQSQYLSNSGRLFFTSADALVPAAAGATRKELINGKEETVGAENVYQYEPSGVGNCTQEHGCIALISSGTSGRESTFLDASANGNDVFFLTAAPLTSQDKDNAYDVYDAHVCGEGAEECIKPPPPPPPACGTEGGEECRHVTGSVPPSEAPASSTFSGPGSAVHTVNPPASGTLNAKTVVHPALTNAQKLAKALAVCHKMRHKTKSQKKKRSQCEKQARKKYGAKKASRRGR